MPKVKGVSFFCPAYYDAKNIARVVKKAIDVFSNLCEDYEIIVVNDGSPDNTGEVIDKLASTYKKVKAVHHPRNLGYAEALKTGFKNARKFEFVLFTDGDNQYDVGYFRKMIPYLNDHDAVITYRTENANGPARQIISWVFNRVLNITFFEPYKDLSSAFRLVKRSALNGINFETDSIFFPIEIILKLHQKNLKIKEVPIKTRERAHGRSTSLLPKNVIGLVKDIFKVKFNSL